MSIILFIIILALLILVHEFGHFIVAVKSGIKVSEFGIGFPPRLATLFRWKETDFTLNAIPFGGFVKIFGENPDEASLSGPESARSFVNKPKSIQALVLVAGVACNIIFAWLLISFGFMWGLPTPVGYNGPGTIENAQVIITSIAPQSPAEASKIHIGDSIRSVYAGDVVLTEVTPDTISQFIETYGDESITFVHARGDETLSSTIIPQSGIVENRKAVGISMDLIGTLQLPIHYALWEGAKTTVSLTKVVVVGLAVFLFNAVTGNGDFSQVTGPVGIVGMVGDVSQLGFVYLLSFTAFISINLAVINLIPFPALDGGRLLFVLIEKIKGSAISVRVANTLNGIGFVLLLLLMVVVTFNDILKLF